jgi:DNA-dependent RNA polymerase auxiliary subunit epsilon
MTLKEKVCEPFDGLKKETADKLVKIADDYAIEFLEWVDSNFLKYNDWDTDTSNKQLLEIFKKEKGL